MQFLELHLDVFKTVEQLSEILSAKHIRLQIFKLTNMT